MKAAKSTTTIPELAPNARVRPLLPGEAKKNDTVFEKVAFGSKPEDVKYRAARVMKDMGNAVLVVKYFDKPNGGNVSVKVNKFVVPDEEAAMPIVEQRRPKMQLVHKAEESADPYHDWISQGIEVYSNLDNVVKEKRNELDRVESKLQDLDRLHNEHIEHLERSLKKAKEDHQNERSLLATRYTSLEQDLKNVESRKKLMEELINKGIN